MAEKSKPFSNWTSTEKVILERRSVRKYKEKQVPEYLIKRILEAGRFAPSAGNCQPWKFIVVRDKEMIDEMERDVIKMCKLFKSLMDWRERGISGKLAWLNAKFMIRLMPNELHPIPFGAIALMADGVLKLYHDAPTVILLLMDTRGIGRPLIDIGICGQNMILAAHSFGLGTCWIGFAELVGRSRKWRKRFGIEYPYKLVEGITIGYPVGNPDGMVERETHEIDWYENGEKRILF